jgi:hypothetical protein
VSLAEHLRAQPGIQWDTQAVGHALPATVQQTATYQERPSLRSTGGAVAGDGQAKTTHEPAERRGSAVHDGPKNRVDDQRRRQGLDERRRKKSSEGTGGGGAVIVPVPSDSATPSSAMNIL